MTIEVWEDLICLKCQSNTFMLTHAIGYHPSLGSHPKENGVICANCRHQDTRGQLIHHAKIRAKRAMAEEAKAELESLTAFIPPFSGSNTESNTSGGRREGNT